MSGLRIALRSLMKNAGTTLVMVVTLAVAIGAATVVFSTLDTVWRVVIGALGSLAAARTASTLLVGVTPADPPTHATAIAVLAADGVAACHVPARRAARVDPMTAIRSE